MNFQPLGERVLIKRIEEAKTTASGIIIPDNAKEKPSRGEVVEVSSEVKNISVKDIVLFGKYAGTEISLDSEDFLVVEASDTMGILK